VVRTIYSGIKQISETIFAQSEPSFEKACLIEYPRRGIWALGFISTDAKAEIAAKTDPSGEMASIFLPTTPNPTSGFLLFVPKKDVIELDMSVEDSAKLVISAGLVYTQTSVADRPMTPRRYFRDGRLGNRPPLHSQRRAISRSPQARVPI